MIWLLRLITVQTALDFIGCAEISRELSGETNAYLLHLVSKFIFSLYFKTQKTDSQIGG